MAELLRVDDLRAGYGEAVVVQGLGFSLDQGQSLALLGRNGTGKTTLINTLVGVTKRFSGRIVLAGQDLTRLPAHARVAAGIGWVPQERNIFKSLTTEENLSAVARPGPWSMERVYTLFPRLRERASNMGHQLSGGEQQMLAVARALVLNPKLLLLDEPLEGLAPIIVEELLGAIARVVREEGLSAIIVEQQQLRIQHQRPRHREHLLLAARQRARVLTPPLAEDRKQLEHALQVASGVALLAPGVQADAEILLHGEVHEGAAPLRHVRDAHGHDLLGGLGLDGGAAEADGAPGSHHGRDRAQGGGLAGTVGAQHRRDPPVLQGETHAVQRLRAPVEGFQLLDLEDGAHAIPRDRP